MENLGAMAYSRYTGFREITDRDVLELHCIHKEKRLNYLQTVETLLSAASDLGLHCFSSLQWLKAIMHTRIFYLIDWASSIPILGVSNWNLFLIFLSEII